MFVIANLIEGTTSMQQASHAKNAIHSAKNVHQTQMTLVHSVGHP